MSEKYDKIILGRYFSGAQAILSALNQAGYADAQKVYSVTKRALTRRTGATGKELFALVGSVLYPVTLEKVPWSVDYVETVELPEPSLSGSAKPSRKSLAKAGKASEAVRRVKAPKVNALSPDEAVLSALAGRKCKMGTTVDWVMQHLDDPSPDMAEAPSLAAWSLRRWALESTATRSEFYRTFAVKRLPTQRQIEIQEKMRDDGRDIDERILEVIAKREALDDDEVQPEGSEEDFGESDFPPEFY